MGNKKKNKDESRCSFTRDVKSGAIGGIVAGVALMAINGSFALFANLTNIPQDIQEIKASVSSEGSKIDSLKEGVNGLKTDIAVLRESIKGIEKRMDGLESRIGSLELTAYGFTKNETVPGEAIDITPWPEIAGLVIPKGYFNGSGSAKSGLLSKEPEWESTEVIASGANGELTAADLQNENIIFSFEEEGRTVFFYGKFNDRNRWDGRCVTNVYQDGMLIVATDAYYSDGSLLRYEQLFSSGGFYYYSDRDGDESGDTWKYTGRAGIAQAISRDDPKPQDLFVPGTFRNSTEESLLHIYHGGISGGYYSDATGEAYMVCYYEDGKTRLVCQGRFKDGDICDDTGEAWSIAMDREQGACYAYYKGIMRGNDAVRSSGDIYKQVTMQEADGYIAGTPFESLVDWDEKMFYNVQ